MMRKVFLAGLCLALAITPALASASLPAFDDDRDMPGHDQPPAFSLPAFDDDRDMPDHAQPPANLPDSLPEFDGPGILPDGIGVLASRAQEWANRKVQFINDYFTSYPNGFSGLLPYGTYTANQAVGWDYLKEILEPDLFDEVFEAYQQHASSYENGRGRLIVWKYFDWYHTQFVNNIILLGDYNGNRPGDTLHYSFASSSQTGSVTSYGNWWAIPGTGQVRSLYTWFIRRTIPPDASWSDAEGFQLERQVRHTTVALNPSKSQSQWWTPHLLGAQGVTVGSPNQSFGPWLGMVVGYYQWEPDSSNLPMDDIIGGWPFIERPPVARHASTITKYSPLYFTDEVVNWEYIRHFGRENIPVIHTLKDAYDKLQGEHVYWFYIIYSTEKKRTPQVSLFGVAFYGGTPDDVPSKINLSPKKHILISSVGDFQFYTDDPNDYYPPGAGYLAYNLFPADSKRPDGKYTAASDNIGLKGLLCDFIPKDVTYIYKAGPFILDAEIDIPPAYNPPSPDTDLEEGDTGPEDNIITAFLRRLFVPDPNMIIDKISLESAVSGFTSPVFALVAGFNDLRNFVVYDGFPRGIVLWGTDFADVLNPIFRKTFLVPLVNTEFSLFSLSRVLSGVALTGLMVMSLISTLLSFFTGGNEQ